MNGKFPQLKDPKTWFYSLIAAALGGFWGAVESALVLPLLDSEKFNLKDGLHNEIRGIFLFACLSSVKVVASYLKKSPVPAIEIDDTDKPS